MPAIDTTRPDDHAATQPQCTCGAVPHPHTIDCATNLRDPADDKPSDPVAGEGTDAERGTWR